MKNGAMTGVSYPGFRELPHGYTRLFEREGARSYYYHLSWFANFVETALDEDANLRIYGVEMNDESRTPVAALATQYKVPRGGMLKPLTLSALSNYYTSLFGPVVDAGDRFHDAVGTLVRTVCSDTPKWDIVDLRPLDPESPTFGELMTAFRSTGMAVQTYFCFGDWYLPVGGRSYKEYFETLPSVMKNTLKRNGKKLEKAGRTRIEIVAGMEGLEEAIQGYEKVYGASWKVPEPYPLFTAGLIRTCAKMGWLRLGLLYVNDEPVAAQLWIVHNGVASIFKLAYDERFSHLSVGSVLHARLMEYVIEVDKVKEVDYLSGDHPYKKDWMSHRRERWGIMAFNRRTVKGVLGIVRHIWGRELKTRLLKLKKS